MIDPLSPGALRWTCPEHELAFDTTEALEPSEGIVGQDEALEALRFGLAFRAPGQHVFVRGLEGTGRLSLVRALLARPTPLPPSVLDRVFVPDFDQPDQPALIELAQGRAPAFRDAIADLSKFVEDGLVDELEDCIADDQRALDARSAEEIDAITEPFEGALAEAGLALAQVTSEDGESRTLVLPMIEGRPVPFDELHDQVARGARSAADVLALEAEVERHSARLGEVARGIRAAERAHGARLKALQQAGARQVLRRRVEPLRVEFPRANAFLEQLVEQLVRHVERLDDEPEALAAPLTVNILRTNPAGSARPVIVETAPSVQSLLGTIDAPIAEGIPPHLGIRAGALVRADGGTLVLHARTLLSQDGAWEALVRTLRSGVVQLLPDDQPTTLRPPGIKPQPIPIDVKVVLVGDAAVHVALDLQDPDFPNLFKILVDFEDTLAIGPTALGYYAQVIARIAREEGLPPFERGAVAALVEHGARIAAERGRLTARFGRIGDIAREAAFLTREGPVRAEQVHAAVARTKYRADGPGRMFRQRVTSGAIRILTRGVAVGEINGLAVISAGPLTYGVPTRITATAGPGSGGAVNVEEEALLSGQIHVKSHHIVSGLLRRLLGATHPLAFDASLVFEQSYGGIDGDSASGASFVVLLSALTGLPIRQGIAMTGAVDQMGNVLAVGAVNEKIEGFFDGCSAGGRCDGQGVVIPAANAGDLMLRQDVVEAAADGRFSVWAVSTIEQVIALYFDRAAAEVLAIARDRLRTFWRVVGSGNAPASSALRRQLRRVALQSAQESDG